MASIDGDVSPLAHVTEFLVSDTRETTLTEPDVENPRKVKFTVTPVKLDPLIRTSQDETKNHDGLVPRPHNRKYSDAFTQFEQDDVTLGTLTTPSDTLLTQSSITALLSSKFKDFHKKMKQYGLASPRFRKRLVSKWESLNYDKNECDLYCEEEHDNQSKKKYLLKTVSRWVIMFIVGIGAAVLAAGIHIIVEVVAHKKFGLIQKYIDKCAKENCLIIPVLIWSGINLVVSLLAAALVTYLSPMAAGSGIPLIKSYLNGVKIPGLLSLQCFIAKTVGVVLSILGGLACGKEGPMAHSGSIIAAGLGKGRIHWCGKKRKEIKLVMWSDEVYESFRSDHEIRDFVAGGAASGVSAAFGAPVGGTLFSVEEAASFWNTELVWRVFFSAMVACFTTNVLISAFNGDPTHLSNPGLVRFDTFQSLSFNLIEIPVFMVMAVIGGLIGALFVVLNYKLTVFRQKYLHRYKWIKISEAGLVAVVSAIIGFMMMYGLNDCVESKPSSHHALTSKMFCEDKKYNSMSSLFLTTPEGCLKALLHDPFDSFSATSLVAFVVVFFMLGVWTYGLSVSSGVFIPSLAIGAAWGRLVGMGVIQLFPDQAKDLGKYALIGAAAQLGGILRTTISLTVIIVECTGDISFGLCIMIALMVSKWVGDFFTTGLYDMNIEVSGIPILMPEPPPMCEHLKASEVMSQPVLSLYPKEKVGYIIDVLIAETFSGFPIIEPRSKRDQSVGKLKGLILSSQLLTLLRKKNFAPEGMPCPSNVRMKDFNDPFPTELIKIEDIDQKLTDEEKECVIDFRPYMNKTPYTVSPEFSMPRVFRLFRGLGLRHIIIVNDRYEPLGMVTRKDLAKFRAESKRGMLKIEHLKIEDI
ncbi:H(+)/Cl(-) exchange transporter 7-like isoform X2 [Gigantopelta aegis]|uniref:H(+)/Cl(-) exchange transporter 7-like isoform X2 n=1 Tax=Gigantopelta aegis TaxID=1735272 RepID=UPI001B8890E7|nr:H(+)/Cl(-) exchange transporter 7-like isoform X2 [Gigantopelta aegis]